MGPEPKRGKESLLAAFLRPEVLFAGSFGLLCLIGWTLLSLTPSMAAGAADLSAIDALFTATSAACVTGLTVRDTGSEFSSVGQWILLALIQVGGLGIITCIGVLVVSSGRSSISQLVALRKIVNAESIGDVGRHLVAILLTAIVIEIVGAAVLFLVADAATGSVTTRLFGSIFHSVSAFCNAGFSLQSDSLTTSADHWPVNLTMMGLIILGGLGVPVVRDLAQGARSQLSKAPDKPRHRLRIQTRLTLVVTIILVFGGAIAFGALESGGALAGSSASDGALVSLFQSVTTRTAGFNSVPIGELSDATLILLGGLMVIGAGPVSTGGGIKTVAFAVLLLTIRSMLTGKKVEAFGRHIPDRFVRAAVSIFLLYVFGTMLVCFGLSITDPELSFLDRAFETVSAMSTVGLSTGHTAEISSTGKLILCLAMFTGRIGPLSLVMTVVRAESSRASYELPEEQLFLS